MKTKQLLLTAIAPMVLAPAALAAVNTNAAQPIVYELTIQPIVVSNNNGTDTASYFGTGFQQNDITTLIDQIWHRRVSMLLGSRPILGTAPTRTKVFSTWGKTRSLATKRRAWATATPMS